MAAFCTDYALEIQLLATWNRHLKHIPLIKLKLLMTCKLFHSPSQSIMLRDINCTTSGSIKAWTLNIFRNWYENINVVSDAPLFVVTFNFDYESDSCVWWSLDNHIDWEQRLNSNVKTITHEFKFSIWRNKSYQTLIFKTAQTNTLMELNIIEFNGFIFWSTTLCLIIGFIIEA